MTGHRLTEGGLIDRQDTIRFTFNGKLLSGFRGDTVASALIANGITLTSRSFKYHRPRGIVSAGIEESGTFVELGAGEESANLPVTTIALKEGLEVKSVNCWPSPAFDLMGINRLFSRLIPAAFYYKTFKWPNWHWYEPSIRKAAGLASAPKEMHPEDVYETRYAHCDVLIIGAGVAGLSAASVLGGSDIRVIVVDNKVSPGGTLLDQSAPLDQKSPVDWVTDQQASIAASGKVRFIQNATAWAVRDNNLVMVAENLPPGTDIRARGWRIRASRVLVATGAIERSMVFTNNDLPGVMLCSAVSAYINRYAVVPGSNIVVFVNNNSAVQLCKDLNRLGVTIKAIVDSRAHIDEADYDSIDAEAIYKKHQLISAVGRAKVKAVVIRDPHSGATTRVDCDLIAVSGGWNPNVQLFSQSRGELTYDESKATFLPVDNLQPVRCIGAASGAFSFDHCIRQSQVLAEQLAQDITSGEQSDHTRTVTEASTEGRPEESTKSVALNNYSIESLWHVDAVPKPDKAFVDVQNDVTLSDIHLSIREGFSAVEHVKRYTTAGMGMDQGRTGNINVIGAIANQTGQAFNAIGTTTFRAPVTPVEFGVIAGHREGSVVLPFRHTPLTQWHIDQGACMYEAGARWQRPGYYPRESETFQETVDREARTVREAVGVYDGSPLGKFEIKGADALNFIQHVYTGSFASLGVNQGQYGIMLSEDGLILDDGVCFKLDEDHYLLTTSTGNADAVYRHMTMIAQVDRPEWQLHITPVTTQWCNATVCGPLARQLVESLGSNINFSKEDFPFMAMRRGEIAGIEARVCRVSFTGELSYEINVAPRYIQSLWNRIMDTGADLNVSPIGSEANHVLRVEKGFLSLGHEADGTTDPYDLGFSWIVSKTKDDFVGKRAIGIRRSASLPRRELVGLLPENPTKMIPEGAPLTPGGEAAPSEGLVTACVWSVVNNRSVALALLSNGRARLGEQVSVRVKNEIIKAIVTSPCFHDPEGARLKHQ